MTAKIRSTVFLGVSAAIMAIGCNPTAPTTTKETVTPKTSAKSEHDHPHPHPHAKKSERVKSEGGHSHGAGPHDGTLADWGGGKFHVEFTVDHSQQETVVYVLGSDEKTPTPIMVTDGKLLLTIKEPPFQVELVATPLEGETNSSASRYVGKHEKLGLVQEFAGTISGEVEGTPYSGDFKEDPHGHEHK